MEEGPTEQILNQPRHPYTRILMNAYLPATPPAKATARA